MESEARAAGQNLERYMRSLAPEGERSRSALARISGVSRQQLIQWFEGKGEPRFSALGEAAERLGVRRVDLVAAYDGVIAPEQQETPRPEWAEGLEERIVEMIQARVIRDTSVLEPVIRRVAARLGVLQSQGDGDPPEAAEAPPDTAASMRQRSA